MSNELMKCSWGVGGRNEVRNPGRGAIFICPLCPLFKSFATAGLDPSIHLQKAPTTLNSKKGASTADFYAPSLLCSCSSLALSLSVSGLVSVTVSPAFSLVFLFIHTHTHTHALSRSLALSLSLSLSLSRSLALALSLSLAL